MDFDTVARTTFSCRDFTDDPVSDDTVYELLDIARFAPSGGNRQGWRVMVVRDQQIRGELARLAAPGMAMYAAQRAAGENPMNSIIPSAIDLDAVAAAAAARPSSSSAMLASIVQAPVALVVGVDLRVVASMDKHLDRVGVISGASVYPFVWNLLLAARDRGLGGALTTFCAWAEPDVQALLGMPSYVAVAAVVPLGVPKKQLTRLSRNPVEKFATVGRFDGPALTPS